MELVHRPSTPSLPAASLLIGTLLPPVGRIKILVFVLLTWMLDIDAVSLASAQSNIDRNGLSERITLLRADPVGPILLPLIQDMATSYVMHSLKSYLQLTTDVDSISACATRHSMRARKKLHTRRRQRSSNPTPSVHPGPAISIDT